MDPSFSRQHSLYENSHNLAFGSTSSFNNVASKSSSRMGSPAVSSSALGADSRLAQKSDQTPLRQSPASLSWGSKGDQGTSLESSSTGLAGFSAFSSLPGSSALGQESFQNNSSTSLNLGVYNGSQLNGQLGGQYGSQGPGQYSNQYGNTFANQYGAQFAGPQGTDFAFSYGNQYNQHSSQLDSQLGSQLVGQQAGQYGGINGANTQLGNQFTLGNQLGRPGGSGSVNPSQWEGEQDPRASLQALSRNRGTAPGIASGVASTIASPDSGSDEDAVIAPGAIHWNYIDLQGQMQGPFDGMQMHEWLGYMLDATLVRRVNDALFVSLGILKEVLATGEPFIVLLSAKGWASVMQSAKGLMAAQQQKLSASTELKENGQEQDASDLGMDSQTEKPVEAFEEISAGQIGRSSRETSLAPGDNVVSSLVNLKVTGKQATSDPVTVAKSTAATKVLEQADRPSPLNTLAHARAPAVPKQFSQPQADSQNPASQAGFSQEAPPQEAPSQIARPQASMTVPAAASPVTSSATPVSAASIQEPEAAVKSRTEPAQTPVNEPWKKASNPSSQVSIAELRQQELEKQLQKKKAVEAANATPRKNSQARWMPIEHIQQTPPAASSSPVPGWTKKVTGSTRSLAEIQKEQASKVKEASNTMAAMTSSPVITSRPTPRTSGHPQTRSAADANVKSPLKSKVNAVDEPSRKSSFADIAERPRSQRPSGQVHLITPNASKARVTDELVHWARVSFKDLNKGIDAMELLEVFLSLPSNNSAKDFIAESIYSYSKSLDGRRFASEFLNRKKAAEKSMSPGETWQDVLNRFNPNANIVEQDSSFKVVTKKRAPKIARPGDSLHM